MRGFAREAPASDTTAGRRQPRRLRQHDLAPHHHADDPRDRRRQRRRRRRGAVPGPVRGAPPEDRHTTAAQIANFTAFGIFGVVAVVVGIFWGCRSTAPTRAWLVEDRAPDEDEQRRALRTPRRQLVVSATLWSSPCGLRGAQRRLLGRRWPWWWGSSWRSGGATTSAIAYLLAERPLPPGRGAGPVQSPPRAAGHAGGSSAARWPPGRWAPACPCSGSRWWPSPPWRAATCPHQLAVTILGLGGISLVVGLFATWQAAHSVADPVVSVREALTGVGERRFDQQVPVFDGSEWGCSRPASTASAGLREREEMRDLFGRQVGTDVAKAAMERGTDMGGETARGGRAFHRRDRVHRVGHRALAARRGRDAQRVLLRGDRGGGGARRVR